MEPILDYSLNPRQVELYINTVSQDDNEKLALIKFFEVSKYISFEEFQMALRSIVSKFHRNNYAICLFTIDWESIEEKSNYWVYKLLLSHGLIRPTIEIFTEEDVKTAIKLGIKEFVFIDDASFSGYQLFDTVYHTLLENLDERCYIDVNISILIGYVSTRALNIFNMMLSNKPPIIPLDEMSHRYSVSQLIEFNNKLRGRTNIDFVYHAEIKTLSELINVETLSTLNNMGLHSLRYPIYFAHKLPDYISVYSSIYMGITLRKPYDIIPLMNNSQKYYDRTIFGKIINQDHIDDLTLYAPCPPPPYKK